MNVYYVIFRGKTKAMVLLILISKNMNWKETGLNIAIIVVAIIIALTIKEKLTDKGLAKLGV